MNKQVTVNGEKIKVDFYLIKSDYMSLKNTRTEFNCGTYQVTLIINGIEYKNIFTLVEKMLLKTYRSVVSFTCNKTGVNFGDSHVKLIEHVLNNLL